MDAPVIPQRYAALFVDAPNISHVAVDEGPAHRYDTRDIDWGALAELMLDSLHAEHYVYSGCIYGFAADGRTDTANVLRESFRRGLNEYRGKISSFVRIKKDIDAAIVNDLWDRVLLMIEEHKLRGTQAPYEITVLLAGGDGVYASPIESIRRRMPEVTLRLHTFAWSHSVSSELLRTSDYFEPLDKTNAGKAIVRPRVDHDPSP